MYGPEGIQFYTRGKIVTSRWPDPGTSKVDLGLPADALAPAGHTFAAMSAALGAGAHRTVNTIELTERD